MSGFQVFLVEDDDDQAELALHHLQKCAPEARVERVGDGPEAIRRLLEFAAAEAKDMPDLVLLDFKLPAVDGAGVLERVRAEPALHVVPIVVLTTSNAKGDKIAAYSNHANGYVVKPTNYGEYRQLMEKVVGYWRDANERPAP